MFSKIIRMERSGSDNTSILSERGMFKILVLILEVGPCRISRIYDNISRNPRIRTKMWILEEAGLIERDGIDGHAMFKLTRRGELIVEYIFRIEGSIGSRLSRFRHLSIPIPHLIDI